MSFLNIWGRVLAMFPPGTTGGVTQTTFMCVAFEETRFCNQVQHGWEALAAKHDAGSTLTANDKTNLPKVAVGFTQVQIKEADKKKIVSEMALDPEKLRFRDVTGSHDMAIQLGLRYLYARGIGGQVGGHPRRSEFLKAWPAAAKALQQALRTGQVGDIIAALNKAILDSGNRVPHNTQFSPYWDFMFPPGEVAILLSPPVRAMA